MRSLSQKERSVINEWVKIELKHAGIHHGKIFHGRLLATFLPIKQSAFGFNLSLKFQKVEGEILKKDIWYWSNYQTWASLRKFVAKRSFIFFQRALSAQPRRGRLGQLVKLWERKTHLRSSNAIFPLLESYRGRATFLSNEAFFLFQWCSECTSSDLCIFVESKRLMSL